jgi:hypothetical protein
MVREKETHQSLHQINLTGTPTTIKARSQEKQKERILKLQRFKAASGLQLFVLKKLRQEVKLKNINLPALKSVGFRQE